MQIDEKILARTARHVFCGRRWLNRARQRAQVDFAGFANLVKSMDLLGLELEALAKLDLDFDLTLTGFAQAEIDLLIEGMEHPDPAADAIPALDSEQPAVSRLGDLWRAEPLRP